MTKKINLNDSKMWQSLNWDEKEVHPNLKRTDGQVNIARANRIKADNKKWLENVARANNDPEKKAKRKASMPDQSGKNNPFFGKKHNEKTLKINSEWHKGKIPSNKGSKHKQESLIKMRKPRSEEGKANMRGPRQQRTCPHCGKVGAGGNMGRYHFDNCKNK